ncbi:alginate O-acetyltransferase AlgX-related protein [Bizionia sp.]|uniref:alginate O-acetyltransferase AlgX-related protein n=1 Tax=Bizionia sp. TaxID=1954480 RepID=UPI003A900C1F
MKNKQNILHWLFIIIFIMMIVAPNVVMFFKLETTENNENRAFQEVPNFDLNQPIHSLTEFKNYYTENFGLKTTLVNNYIDFKSHTLQETPMPNKVVKGLNGWYFLGNSYNNSLNNAFGNNTFNTEELQEISRRILELKTYLNNHNIAFYIVVPPNKNTVYREHLPYQFKVYESNLSVLKNYLKAQINFEIIDLTRSMIAEKNTNQLYLKTDSHWNEFGAFIGYQETMKTINKDYAIPTVTLEDYNIQVKPVKQGDIIKMINLNIEETAPTLTKKASSINAAKNNHANPKLFMHYDSFSYNWMPYFNESFDAINYVKNYTVNKKQIEEEKPDIVIFEIVERNIDVLFKKKSLLEN